MSVPNVENQCNCCQYPWKRDYDSVESVDSNTRLACSPCLKSTRCIRGFDPSNFDPSVSPKDNFYMWANGGWITNSIIPPDYPIWNTFLSLIDLTQHRLRSIIEDINISENGMTEESRKLRDFYATMMDENAIEEQNITPLYPLLQLCSTVTVRVLYSTYFCIHNFYMILL